MLLYVGRLTIGYSFHLLALLVCSLFNLPCNYNNNNNKVRTLTVIYINIDILVSLNGGIMKRNHKYISIHQD